MAVRITSHRKYNAHMEPIFKNLNILKVMEIYQLNELRCYHQDKITKCHTTSNGFHLTVSTQNTITIHQPWQLTH